MDVLLVYGGRSAERQISVESAGFVGKVLEDSGHSVVRLEIGSGGEWMLDGQPVALKALPDAWVLAGPEGALGFDLVFPVLHGPLGEDGTVQGLCEMAGWKYAGADVLTSSVAMNKAATKRLLEWEGLPTLPWRPLVSGQDKALPDLTDPLSLPVFVKPARLGSSIGISRVDEIGQLGPALDLAFGYDDLVVIEKALKGAREIEVSVLGGRDGVSASVPGEVLPGKDWYDYEAKYECEGSKLVIPADLPADLAGRVRDTAERSFSVLGGTGYGRVDFLLSSGNEFYVNEINTIPGFTSISMFHRLWEETGIPPEELMNRIINEGLHRRPIGLRESVGR